MANTKITVANMAANSIDSDQYVDGSIDTAHIADDAITSAKLDTNIAIAGTLGVTGALAATLSTAAQPNITSVGTLSALTVDTMTLDAATLTTTGDFFIDSAGDMVIDVDGGDIYLNDGGTGRGQISMANTDLTIISATSDRDLIFKGVDGASVITALTLDMSDAGSAIFNNKVGIGVTPAYGLDLLGATNYKTVRIGQATATGTKRQAIAARHYTSSEQDHNMIGMFTDSNTNSILSIGGGLGSTGDFNSVTQIQLHTGNGTTVATTAAMTIDSSGNVTIGSSSLSANAALKFQADTGTFTLEHERGSHALTLSDSDGTGEILRIDTSGNLLVGTTSSNYGVAGSQLGVGGNNYMTRSGANPLLLNRLSSDGAILSLMKDGTIVGGIGASVGDLTIYGTASGHSGFRFTSGGIAPVDNTGSLSANSVDIGQSSWKFRDLYLSGGVHLGGTGSANKLDDYEEGTWTPTLLTGSGTFSGATYTKVGRMVTCNFIVASITNRTSSAPFIIESLPFAAYSGDRCATLGAIPRNINSGFASFDGAYFDTTTRMSFYTTSTGVYRQLLHSDMSSATSTIYIAVTYMAA